MGHSSTSSVRPKGSMRRSAGHSSGSMQLLPDCLPACCAGAGRVRSSSSFVPATEVRALASCGRACDSAATFLALLCVPRGANAAGRTVVRPFSVLLQRIQTRSTKGTTRGGARSGQQVGVNPASLAAKVAHAHCKPVALHWTTNHSSRHRRPAALGVMSGTAAASSAP